MFFEKLPVATRFNPDSLGFLIEINFQKRSKFGKMSKIKKTKFWQFCQFRGALSHFLSQIAFRIAYCFNVQVNECSIPQFVFKKPLQKRLFFNDILPFERFQFSDPQGLSKI